MGAGSSPGQGNVLLVDKGGPVAQGSAADITRLIRLVPLCAENMQLNLMHYSFVRADRGEDARKSRYEGLSGGLILDIETFFAQGEQKCIMTLNNKSFDWHITFKMVAGADGNFSLEEVDLRVQGLYSSKHPIKNLNWQTTHWAEASHDGDNMRLFAKQAELQGSIDSFSFAVLAEANRLVASK